MSILIKGMEMPKNCGECPLTYYEDASCLFTGVIALSIGRQAACPLVPVPPHGRLIDADTPITVYEEGEWGFPVNAKTTVSKFLLGHIIGEIPPTIIEAEVDDD